MENRDRVSPRADASYRNKTGNIAVGAAGRAQSRDGGHLEHLPALRMLIQDAASGGLDVVIVWSPDRLPRSAAAAADASALAKCGTAVMPIVQRVE